MNKGKFWRNMIGLLLVLGLGVGIGIFIGIPIGNRRAEKEAVNRQEQMNSEATKAPEPTNAPVTGSVPTPTEGVGVTVTVIPTITAELKPTGAPTAEENPTMTPPESQKATVSPEATGGATPFASPTVTGGVTGTEEPTPTEGAVAKPTGGVTVTVKPTVTKKPTTVPTPIPVAEGGSGYYGALHVEGTYLADAEGNLVQLRGISTHGLGWFPEFVNEKAIRQLNEEWGCNVLRLAMYTAEYNGYCSSDAAQKQNLKKIIDTGVTAASKQDMYVIIDWHILQDNNPNTNKEEAKKFFAETAEKYGDNPHVIYEICNEPNGGVSWSEIKKYALEVIPVIREHAPEAVIIVGTPTWSQDVDIAAADPITEYDNIMYALHFYADTHRDGLRQKCKTAIQKGLPIFVTEYGVCDASGNGAINTEQANLWISMLDSYGISHVAWNLSNKAESSAMLKSSCSKKNGFTENDLSEGGKWFVDMLKKAGVGVGSALSGTTEAGQGDGVSGGDTSTGTGDSQGNGQQTTDYVAYGESILTPGEGVTLTVSNGWSSGASMGIQLNLTVKNITGSEEKDWERKITVKSGVRVEVAQSWNASVELQGNTLLLRPVEYNKTIAPGASVGDIGVILQVTE